MHDQIRSCPIFRLVFVSFEIYDFSINNFFGKKCRPFPRGNRKNTFREKSGGGLSSNVDPWIRRNSGGPNKLGKNSPSGRSFRFQFHLSARSSFSLIFSRGQLLLSWFVEPGRINPSQIRWRARDQFSLSPSAPPPPSFSREREKAARSTTGFQRSRVSGSRSFTVVFVALSYRYLEPR